MVGTRHTLQSDKPIWRYRLNKSTSVKGVITTDATVEATGVDSEVFEQEAIRYMAWVDSQWPPNQVE